MGEHDRKTPCPILGWATEADPVDDGGGLARDSNLDVSDPACQWTTTC